MLGVTAFGLLFTPTFYVVCPALSQQFGKHTASHERIRMQYAE
ncbi:MAG: hypothetical protein QOI40_1723 [Alphaproteobacteria bacterium]|nr:hypothetical protein [Alphaproteobacteria bacterium]